MAEVDRGDEKWRLLRDVFDSLNGESAQWPKNKVAAKPGRKLIPNRPSIHLSLIMTYAMK